MKQAAIIATLLCALAVSMAGEPNPTPGNSHGSSDPKRPSSFAVENNTVTANYADHPKEDPPEWYAALKRPEWWLVLIAALTGFAIAYQAREMKRATEAMGIQAGHMQGQLTEMQESRKIENKTLILQYRPTLIVREARATEFNVTDLGEPAKGQVKFTVVNKGGSPAHVIGGQIAIWAFEATKHKMTPSYGDEVIIKSFTLQPGEDIVFDLSLSTGAINNIDWANFHEGLRVEPTKILRLVGVFRYVDDLNIHRRVGIMREYDAKTKWFNESGGFEGEYSD